MATLTKLEFAVQMTCQACVDAVTTALSGTQGIKLQEINLSSGQVVVESTLTSEEVKSIIESTGRLAVLLGMGGSNENQLGAAVAALNVGSQVVQGVVRMTQVSEDNCVLEGTVDGLPPGKHSLCIHEAGDISEGCTSCGNVLRVGTGLTEKAAGLLTQLDIGSNGRAVFRLENSELKIRNLIGRSVVIHQGVKPSVDGRLVCGIIARSSGLFQNSKRLCACDGVSIWDERNKPLAGEGRSNFTPQL